MASSSRPEACLAPRSREIRVTTAKAVDPALVCGAVWNPGVHAIRTGFRRRDTLRETDTERWTYEQVCTDRE